MRTSLFSRVLLACGAALILAALTLALASTSGAAYAQTLPPRPTVAPTAAPKDNPKPTAVVPGRITGTVIDQRTGAPAPGVAVRVGDASLTSDASGNYDINGLAPGSYAVALVLAEGQGAAAQGELTLALAAGQTVVQHLFFTSPAPAVAPAEPAPTPAPTPVALPNTGAGADAWALPLALGALLLGAGLATRRAAR
ncbi:cell wall anchor protein [Chloroflexales bacterium ZM16-3]|nr:cell wall anchor protein [Chloroflexales bacterium ZM16-3]